MSRHFRTEFSWLHLAIPGNFWAW